MNNVNAEVYADINVIISMMPAEMKNKISKSFIEFVEKSKPDNFVSNINPEIPLNRQEIRQGTKELMGIIYRDYLCDPDERTVLLEKEARELELDEKKRRKKYNPDEIFGKKPSVSKVVEQVEETEILVVEHEKWYQKLFRRMKKFFSKNG